MRFYIMNVEAIDKVHSPQDLAAYLKSKFSNEVIKCMFSEPQLHRTFKFFQKDYKDTDIFEAMRDRNLKFNRNQNLIERNYKILEPQYRESFNYFREYGIFLPMSSGNAHLNTTNNFLFDPELGWVLNQESNPLYGWPMKKVL